MKYQLVTTSCGVEVTVLSSNNLEIIRHFYNRNRFAYLRLKIDGKKLSIDEADKLCGTPHRGVICDAYN